MEGKTTEQEMPLVEMKGISKSFGEVRALKNVDFNVGRKEIVGLVGDNGAGKTTLVKILTGIHRPDSGEIYYKGKKVNIQNPAIARDMGIEPVHQRGSAIAEMNIWENFFLGKELRKNRDSILRPSHRDTLRGRTAGSPHWQNHPLRRRTACSG